MIKWQSSHPETFSRHRVSNLCCRPSAQQLSLPGVIHYWPHSPRPPSLRMANTIIFRWTPSHVCRNEVNQEECAGGLVLPCILVPGPAMLCMPLPWEPPLQLLPSVQNQNHRSQHWESYWITHRWFKCCLGDKCLKALVDFPRFSVIPVETARASTFSHV